MIIIANSIPSNTEWIAVDNGNIINRAITDSINPYYNTRREISHMIRLQLPSDFFKPRPEHIYFYGVGCDNSTNKQIIEASLTSQFRARVTVDDFVMGVAHSMLGRDEGIACVLGSMSAAGLYDGQGFISMSPSYGVLLGDEGSELYMGIKFAADCLRNFTPVSLKQEFYKEYNIDDDKMIMMLYHKPSTIKTARSFWQFLLHHRDNAYVAQLINHSIETYFRRILLPLSPTADTRVSFVGSVAHKMSPLIYQEASKHNLNIHAIAQSPIEGLIRYHCHML